MAQLSNISPYFHHRLESCDGVLCLCCFIFQCKKHKFLAFLVVACTYRSHWPFSLHQNDLKHFQNYAKHAEKLAKMVFCIHFWMFRLDLSTKYPTRYLFSVTLFLVPGVLKYKVRSTWAKVPGTLSGAKVTVQYLVPQVQVMYWPTSDWNAMNATKLSRLWRMPNSVSKGFDTEELDLKLANVLWAIVWIVMICPFS